ncbi:MAG: AAA family ATPase [Niveispirillum sp.]|uniref:AAA family ATPase n=1 Tax=Niveispirillum sp. TaxID=1917217 RepID=UPI003BA6ADAD
MKTLIKSLQIERFRAFQNLRVDGFGKVNLITGKNNSGKSSLLEAVRILASGGSLKTIFDILNYREELGSSVELDKTYLPTEIAPFCNLFHDFPDISSSKNGFSIISTGSLPESISRISVSINWFTRKVDTESDRQTIFYEPASRDLFDDMEPFPALSLDISGRKRVVPLDRLQRRYPIRNEVDTSPIPCVYLDPFSSRSTSQLGALWDAISLTDAEKDIVKALQVISPDIQAVSMIGSDERSARPRTAIARSARFPSPLPLRSFGDGVNRLFGIILSLCNARNGVLLVDEIENGLHYSVQTEMWRTIFALAKHMNVQVFATSHSWDCVHAFQQAASESPEDGILVRLSRKGESTIPTIFTEQELEIVTRDQIEVR